MGWDGFLKSWRVISCDPGLGLGTSPPTILTFAGDGSGVETSRLTTGSGVVWGTHVKHVGGSGTHADPEVVTLKRLGRDYVIARSEGRIACYPGSELPRRGTSERSGPFAEEALPGKGREGGEGTGTQPVWEGQEGG